jgi:hypothetical protein
MPAVNVAGVLENQVVSRNISISYTLEFYLMNAVFVESALNENAIFENIYRSTNKSDYNRFPVRMVSFSCFHSPVPV